MDIHESIRKIIGVEMEKFNKALYDTLSTDNVLLATTQKRKRMQQTSDSPKEQKRNTQT